MSTLVSKQEKLSLVAAVELKRALNSESCPELAVAMATNGNRTRSADRAAVGPGPDMVGQLAAVFETMWNKSQLPRPVVPQLKTLKYEHHGDVEHFIQQFVEEAGANGWDQAFCILHLQGALKEQAQDC